MEGKLRLGPCRLHLLVVGRLLQLEVPLNRFDVHNKRNYSGIIYSVSQKMLQTELGAQKSKPKSDAVWRNFVIIEIAWTFDAA